MTLEESYINGFNKTAEAFGYQPDVLIKRAGRFATFAGKRIGNFFKYLFGGTVARSKAMGRLGDINKQLAPLKTELKALRKQVRGMNPAKLQQYNQRIRQLQNEIARAYRTRNPAVNIRDLEKQLRPYMNELETLQKKTNGLTRKTLIDSNNRINQLTTDIGNLKDQKKKIYDPIASENRKVRAARIGTLLAGSAGAGLIMNNQKENTDDEW